MGKTMASFRQTTVGNLVNGHVDEIHSRRLTFYRDAPLKENVIMSYILPSETGMHISRLL